MEDTKYFLKSKRFWGMVLSLIGFIATMVGQYFGVETAKYVQAVGTLLQVFGLPITFYGSATADKPLGFKK